MDPRYIEHIFIGVTTTSFDEVMTIMKRVKSDDSIKLSIEWIYDSTTNLYYVGYVIPMIALEGMSRQVFDETGKAMGINADNIKIQRITTKSHNLT